MCNWSYASHKSFIASLYSKWMLKKGPIDVKHWWTVMSILEIILRRYQSWLQTVQGVLAELTHLTALSLQRGPTLVQDRLLY